MMNKYLAFILAGFLLLGIIYGSSQIVKFYSENKIVYASTIFGCLKLKDRYTQEQWEAKQDFSEKYFGYKITRCD